MTDSAATMKVAGRVYRLAPLSDTLPEHGAMLRYADGGVVRRVVGRDGGDVILRGVRSTDVLEAVSEARVLDEWLRMVPVR